MHKKLGFNKFNSFMINQTYMRLFTVFFSVILLVAIAYMIFASSMRDIYISDKRESSARTISNASNSIEKVFDKTMNAAGRLYNYDIEKLFRMLKDDPDGCTEVVANITDEYSYIGNALLVTGNSQSIIGVATEKAMDVQTYMNCLPYKYDEIMKILDSGNSAYDFFAIKKPSASSLYRELDDFCLYSG